LTTPLPEPHPVRIQVDDALERSRLTVFFRLLFAIPHFLWLYLWGIGVFFIAIINWFATLIRGQTPDGLHRFMTSYVRYATHVLAYVSIAANPYPGFTGDPGYAVDVVFDPPARQSRWKVAFRIFLALPALLLAAVLTGGGGGGGGGTTTYSGDDTYSTSTDAGFTVFGVLALTAVLVWFYALARARAPEGIARLQWYALHYGAQTWAYVLLVTDRYPNSDPTVLGVPRRPPPHPVVLREAGDDLARSRLTIFFRLPLVIPHFFWLALWTVLVVVLAFVNWIVTLIRGRSPDGIHNFFSAYLRYATHVYAFATVVANPFPGFTGKAGSYPVDVEVAPPEPQRRAVTFFRFLLAIPAFIIQSGLGAALYAVAFLGWFAALFTGRMPRGLRNLGAFALRYAAQATSYGFLLLTERYPYAGPPANDEELPEEAPPANVEPPSPDLFDPTSTDELAPGDPRLGWREPPFLKPPQTDG
jgi:Domain of unknown function (DUF4389)